MTGHRDLTFDFARAARKALLLHVVFVIALVLASQVMRIALALGVLQSETDTAHFTQLAYVSVVVHLLPAVAFGLLHAQLARVGTAMGRTSLRGGMGVVALFALPAVSWVAVPLLLRALARALARDDDDALPTRIGRMMWLWLACLLVASVFPWLGVVHTAFATDPAVTAYTAFGIAAQFTLVVALYLLVRAAEEQARQDPRPGAVDAVDPVAVSSSQR